MEQTFRIMVVLPKPEAEALARVARREIRNLRDQASYMVREALVAKGELPAPADPNSEVVFMAEARHA
jgi:hypothetical protein